MEDDTTFMLVTVLSGIQPAGKPKAYQQTVPGRPIADAVVMIDKGYRLDARNYEVRQDLNGSVYVVAVLYGRADDEDWHKRLPARGFKPATKLVRTTLELV